MPIQPTQSSIVDYSLKYGVHQIKASAGSGKTYNLINILLALLAQEGEQNFFKNILAITFTNAAASDMRAKLLGRLKEIALEVPTAEPHFDWDKEHALKAVDRILMEYSSLGIRTIDSFLHLLVRLSALDLNLPPQFETVFKNKDFFDSILDVLALSAVEELEKTEGEQSLQLYPLYEQMYQTMISTTQTKKFIAGEKIRAKIITVCDIFLDMSDDEISALSSVQEINNKIAELIGNYRKAGLRLHEYIQNTDLEFAKPLKTALEKISKAEDTELPIESTYFQEKSFFEALSGADKKKFTRSDESEELYAQFQSSAYGVSFAKTLRTALKYTSFVELAKVVRELLNYTEQSEEKMLAKRILYFAEQAITSGHGLAAVVERLGSDLKYILIDEFQDTSRGQWAVLEEFAKESLGNGGSLSYVGDLKQAIYSWRGGDSLLFEEVKKNENLCPPSHVHTTLIEENWRSKEKIIEFNNFVFGQLADPTFTEEIRKMLFIKEEKNPFFVDYAVNAFKESAQKFSPRTPKGGTVALHFMSQEKKAELDQALMIELPKLVHDLATRFNYADIAILVRKNEQCKMVAQCLLAENIPVVSEGSLLLAEQKLIQQCISFLEFLKDNRNDLALWHVLAFEGIFPPLEEIDSELTQAELNDFLCDDRDRPLYELLEEEFPYLSYYFDYFQSSSRLCTVYNILNCMYESFDLLGRYASQSGFLLRLLEVAHKAELNGIKDLTLFLAYWYENSEEEKTPLPEGVNAVQVLTVHKSKGAQYQAVIVPWDISKLPPRRDDNLVCYENVFGITCIAPISPSLGEEYSRHQAINALEILDVLYVAYTRAMSELHIFFPKKAKKNATANPLIDTVLPKCVSDEKEDVYFFGEIPTNLKMSPHTISLNEPENEYIFFNKKHTLPLLKEETRLSPLTLDASERGTLFHNCLEKFIQLGALNGRNAKKAIEVILRSSVVALLPIEEKQSLYNELSEMLVWFMNLPDAQLWVEYGEAEQSCIDEKGFVYRIDLLVVTPENVFIIDYKTGLKQDAYALQVKHYIRLIKSMEQYQNYSVSGILLYVDSHECVEINDGAC